jgi:hypothetical protein
MCLPCGSRNGRGKGSGCIALNQLRKRRGLDPRRISLLRENLLFSIASVSSRYGHPIAIYQGLWNPEDSAAKFCLTAANRLRGVLP